MNAIHDAKNIQNPKWKFNGNVWKNVNSFKYYSRCVSRTVPCVTQRKFSLRITAGLTIEQNSKHFRELFDFARGFWALLRSYVVMHHSCV